MVHAHHVLTEGLAERPGFRPSFLVQVSLGRAVVDLESGRVAVAGRRVAMADQRDMTAIDQCGPGFLGIIGSRYRRGEQPNGKNGEHEPLHMRRVLYTAHVLAIRRFKSILEPTLQAGRQSNRRRHMTPIERNSPMGHCLKCLVG